MKVSRDEVKGAFKASILAGKLRAQKVTFKPQGQLKVNVDFYKRRIHIYETIQKALDDPAAMESIYSWLASFGLEINDDS